MADVVSFDVTNATKINGNTWVTIARPQGPWDGPAAYSKKECRLKALAGVGAIPEAPDWDKIRVAGGSLSPANPYEAILDVSKPGKITIAVGSSGSAHKIDIWVVWAQIKIHTAGPRPRRSIKFSEHIPADMYEEGKCGAFKVLSLGMGEGARGQIVAEAKIAPKGIGQLLKSANVPNKWMLRRELTAHDYVDGRRFQNDTLKGFKPWVADDSPAGWLMLDPSFDDTLYDTDGPTLAAGLKTAETYNNFRQWVEWNGMPCSHYARWFFRARWKEQKVILNDVGEGNIELPERPHFKP